MKLLRVAGALVLAALANGQEDVYQHYMDMAQEQQVQAPRCVKLTHAFLATEVASIYLLRL